MISRVADHCFWLGRYLERAEHTARVLHVTTTLSLDAELSPEQTWAPIVIVFGEREPFYKKHGEGAGGDGEVVQAYMTWDEDNWSSVVRSVAAARENARSIRDVVSLEVWEITNELYLYMTAGEGRQQYNDNRWTFYRTVRKACELCLGFTQSTMLHESPLDFIWLGVELERAGQTARNLDVHHHAFTTLPNKHEVVETALWLSLLRSCSGFEPFMKRHRGAVTGRSVASFLLHEPTFPRSVRHAVEKAYDRLSSIRPPEQLHLPGGRSLERLAMLSAYLVEESPVLLGEDRVHDIVTHVVDETTVVGNELAQDLFGYGR
ncbi:MAG: alpha-E domain-containing protein [Polyangiaceae bacterium]|nr:alpha-E domain-containing protein [Polyangiaceae bacterium]